MPVFVHTDPPFENLQAADENLQAPFENFQPANFRQEPANKESILWNLQLPPSLDIYHPQYNNRYDRQC